MWMQSGQLVMEICLGRSVSKGYCGSESMHMEIRARIVIDGVLHKEHYLSHKSLARGATLIHEDQDLPSVYAKIL